MDLVSSTRHCQSKNREQREETPDRIKRETDQVPGVTTEGRPRDRSTTGRTRVDRVEGTYGGWGPVTVSGGSVPGDRRGTQGVEGS